MTNIDLQALGLSPLILRNDFVELTLLPGKGCDIYSLIDMRTGIDVLFKTPWGVRSPGLWSHMNSSYEHWMEAYAGGWQILLPNGGDECVEKGTTWGYHGEASLGKWSLLDRTSTEADLEIQLFTVPLKVQRHFQLDGPVLRIREIVTNVSQEVTEFMWSHHPAFGAPFLEDGCVLSTGFRSFIADELNPGSILSPGSQHSWPIVTSTSNDRVDLRRLPGPLETRAMLGYLFDIAEPFFAITNPKKRLGIGIRWSGKVFDKAWLWQEVHSGNEWPWFGRAYAIAVEPASTIPGHGMTYAREKGFRGVELGASMSTELIMEAVLFEGTDPVSGIQEGGLITFQKDVV